MKKILISIILFVNTLYAKPCMTDIYFGNGIWSQDEEQQEKSLEALINIVNLDKSKEGQAYNYRLAYNPGHGTTNDLIETYWQLKESGQISEGYFSTIARTLSGKIFNDSFSEKLREIVTNYNEEVNTMYTTYNETSFKKKHNVLLVAHSQGNLFGNKMYKLFDENQKKKFRMVSVGTVANEVAGDGNYVNVENDSIVSSIPNSLKGDFDGTGHSFQGTYLNIESMRKFYETGSTNAGAAIASHVKNAYNNLKQTEKCTEYDYVYLYVDYAKDSIRIVGKIANVFENELIAEEPLAFTESSSCGNDYPYVFMTPLLDLQINDSAIWTISPFETQNDVALKEYSVLKYQFGNHCVVKSFSGDIYDAAYSALQKN